MNQFCYIQIWMPWKQKQKLSWSRTAFSNSSALHVKHGQEQTFPKGDKLLEIESKKLCNVVGVVFHDSLAHPLKQGLEAPWNNHLHLWRLHLHPLKPAYGFSPVQTEFPWLSISPAPVWSVQRQQRDCSCLLPYRAIHSPPPAPPKSLLSLKRGYLPFTVTKSFTPPSAPLGSRRGASQQGNHDVNPDSCPEFPVFKDKTHQSTSQWARKAIRVHAKSLQDASSSPRNLFLLHPFQYLLASGPSLPPAAPNALIQHPGLPPPTGRAWRHRAHATSARQRWGSEPTAAALQRCSVTVCWSKRIKKKTKKEREVKYAIKIYAQQSALRPGDAATCQRGLSSCNEHHHIIARELVQDHLSTTLFIILLIIYFKTKARCRGCRRSGQAA